MAEIFMTDSLNNVTDLILNMLGDHLDHFNKLSHALFTISDSL